MLKVLLTGGIGSGKSTVGRIFSVLEVPVFEADAKGRHLLASDPGVKKAVIERFGEGVFANGNIDRKALATIVFNDPQALNDLNAIIHPLVRKAFHAWAGEQNAPYVMMEAAIQGGAENAFDRVVMVTAPEEMRIRRVMERDGVDEQAVRDRMRNQSSTTELSASADHVVMNDEQQLVIPQVLAIHSELALLRSA